MPEQPSGADAELQVAEVVGHMMQFWGFKRAMGRLWTVLYLSPRALTASELGSRLDMSAGAVSMGLAELERWECVRRTRRPDDRHDYFEAEADIWKMVRRVLAERELTVVEQFHLVVSSARDQLAPEAPHTAQAERESTSGIPSTHPRQGRAQDLRHKRDRLERLERLSRVGEGLLRALVEGRAVDPSPIVRSGSGDAPEHPSHT